MKDPDKLPKISSRLQKNASDHMFEFSENGMHHNSYDQEVREQTAIENGDLDALKEALEEDYSGTVGVLSPNELRNWKNLSIVVLTLASRSAIRGGLSPEISFSLSDTFINEIEKQTRPDELQKLLRSCEYQYCRLVHEEKLRQKGLHAPRKNPHIHQCKDYIFSHLHDKITVQDIADALHLNSNYLSDLFREHEGIPLSRYIMQEKLNRAMNLLKYSDYSYSDIASYLGFSSQSHLGTQFKAYTGYTLRQYREEFKKQERFE